jgi:cytochrome oxidase Cu insertion factor (SCO1/SenC/PrrC family)
MTFYGKEECMKTVVLSLCIFVLIVFATAPAEAQYQVGDPVADFTLNDAYGTPVSLSDFEGMVVVLNFWADW